MTEDLVSFNIRVPPILRDQVDEIASKRNTSRSEIARELLDSALNRVDKTGEQIESLSYQLGIQREMLTALKEFLVRRFSSIDDDIISATQGILLASGQSPEHVSEFLQSRLNAGIKE